MRRFFLAIAVLLAFVAPAAAQTQPLLGQVMGQPGAFRAAMGLGTAAAANTGTSGAAVPLLNGAATVSGAWAFSGGLNVTASTGLQFSGTTILAVSLNANGPVLLGPSAGAALPSNDENGCAFVGAFAGNTAAACDEMSAVGNNAWRYSNAANSGNTGEGDGCGWHETYGTNDFCFAADSYRNGAGNSDSGGIGRRSFQDWFGTQTNSMFGAFAGEGNAAAIFVKGSPTTGDTIPVIFTDADLPGGQQTITYTVLSTDTTNAILANSIAATVTAAFLTDNVSATNDEARNPGVVAVTHPGNTTIAGGGSATLTVTIGSIGGAATETLTVTNGAVGNSNTAVGAFAMEGFGISTAANNFAGGEGTLAELTTGIGNNCLGFSGCTSIKAASMNNVVGSLALSTTFVDPTANSQLMGAKCGNTLIGGNNEVILGDCQSSLGFITTANDDVEIGNNVQTPDATTSGSLSIQNAIYGKANYNTLSTISVGCIGFYLYACNTGTVEFAVPIFADKSLLVGGTGGSPATGEVLMKKITASGTAPGASAGKFAFVCGTNSGTAKMIAYAGTSTTATTIVDNVGGGVSGC